MHSRYSMPDSIMNRLGQGMEAEFEHNLGAVALDGPDTDLQQRSDLLVCFSFCQKDDDLRLAGNYPRTCALLSLML